MRASRLLDVLSGEAAVCAIIELSTGMAVKARTTISMIVAQSMAFQNKRALDGVADFIVLWPGVEAALRFS